MITHALATAQILLILVSDSRHRLQEMTRDLQHSRYCYFLAPHAERANLVGSVTQRIAGNDGRLPIVLLIDHKFAGKDCTALLALARGIRRSTAIECIVTDPPMLASRRHLLEGLGARLFDNDASVAVTELVLH
jgi:hypothetical protein